MYQILNTLNWAELLCWLSYFAKHIIIKLYFLILKKMWMAGNFKPLLVSLC